MTETTSPQTRAEKLVSFLIASVAILAAIITTLQTYAAGKGNEAERLSSQYAIEAMQVKSSGQTRVSHERQGAYQTWYELDLQALGADLAGDADAAARYRAVRDHIATLVPIFADPYFNPDSGFGPDVARYESDTYVVESTRLTEKFTAYNELGNAWDNRANIFIVHLTLLAVTLSLYGLSTTLRGFMRGVFIGLGSLIASVVVLWALVAMLLPIPSVSEAAINAYADGVGKAWYGDANGAIADFDRALSIRPNYANALYERGNAYYYNGDYQSSLINYESALSAGRADTNVGWNIGWNYYMLGRFDEAINMDRRVLEQDPSLLGVQFNLALSMMARGDFSEAEAEYYKGVNEAVAEVTKAHEQGLQPPSSFWYYMDASAQDIDNLLLELDGNAKPWSQVPSRGTITADQTQLRTLASNMFHLLKETTTALEFTGAAPTPNVTFTATAFQFAQEELDSNGAFIRYNIAASFPSGINSMVILFDYSGATPGQSETWKIYRNGYEDPTLRSISQWALQESGSAAKPISYAYSNLFIFASGEYTVELYIDNHLVQRGTFIVE
jgi:tetratricopeptide (TPR) repeat protein